MPIEEYDVKEKEIYDILLETAEDVYPIALNAIENKIIEKDYDINKMECIRII